jgi:hypothetical protein
LLPALLCDTSDGCDIAGKNVFVQNLTITNFDDTVCIKPLNQGDSLSQCAYVPPSS